MNVRIFDFSKYHGKYPDSGSTHIRVNQIIKHWPEADKYSYGEHPDVLIFQKVYCTPDYKFPAHYPGIRILDCCDADWLDGLTSIAESVNAVDAVTCSSDNLTNFIKQLTDKPVITVPDRFDVSLIPDPKKHRGKAKTVVWFGYRHNAETLRPAMQAINAKGLNLLVIAEDDPLAWSWLPRNSYEEFRAKRYSFIKYNEDTIYYDLQRADFCLLPNGMRPVDYYKSNNKTIKAMLAGLPVAYTGDEMDYFMDGKVRQNWINERYESTFKEYDCRNSVEQYKQLIHQLMDKQAS